MIKSTHEFMFFSNNVLGFMMVFAVAGMCEAAVPEYAPNWSVLEGLTESKLQQMTLQDETLAMAYVEAFMSSEEGGETPPQWLQAVRRDLLRRGNAATPLLLELFRRAPIHQFREELLFKVASYPSIDVQPFIEESRKYWRENHHNTPPRTCYAISSLLTQHGSAEDKRILVEMLKHPEGEVGFFLKNSLKLMERRLAEARDSSARSGALGRPPTARDPSGIESKGKDGDQRD